MYSSLPTVVASGWWSVVLLGREVAGRLATDLY